MDKKEKLPANRILGQTTQNTPHRPCMVETSLVNIDVATVLIRSALQVSSL